jgi:tryptophan-rich sensory protein
MRPNRWLVLLGFLAAAFAAAGLGGLATASSVGTWYLTLHKPSWNPPGWLFGPVWSVLYTFMAIAAWRIWNHAAAPGVATALRWFFVQLALNALWSGLFFGLRNPGLALAEILLLLAALVVVQVRFWGIDRVAGALWAPYLAWVSFATILNATVWWLNRG